jgi:nucleotide-binding universal stress UspA family protein
MFTNILVPTDGSEHSARAASVARSLATQRGVTTIETVTGEGDAAKQILESAKREGVDGIVMGSVSHKVFYDAECTCVTVT